MMNDDGIDSHVPPLLSSLPGHRHQPTLQEITALQLDIKVSATLVWYLLVCRLVR